jgi:hypothetical protein
MDTFNSLDYIMSNERMNNEWIGKDVEGSGHVLLRGTVPAFPGGKTMKRPVRIAGFWAKI